MHATLDPVALLHDIRALQGELVILADRSTSDDTAAPTAPTLEQFLAGYGRRGKRARHARRRGQSLQPSVAGGGPIRSQW
jgi:hypothetical protein